MGILSPQFACKDNSLTLFHSIYKEIGPGQRIALSKLAVDKFEETGRPLRIAVDISIWLFQIQASKGINPSPEIERYSIDIINRRHESCASNLLLPTTKTHLPLHPPSLRLRRTEQATFQEKQTNRPKCRIHTGIPSETITQTVRSYLPHCAGRSRSRMRFATTRRHRGCCSQ